MGVPRRWRVRLIRGAGEVGQIYVGVGILEVDDFQVALDRLTTLAPHFSRINPGAVPRLDDEQKLAFAIRYADVLLEQLDCVIPNDFDGVPAADRAHAVFVVKHDEEQIGRNNVEREGAPQLDLVGAHDGHVGGVAPALRADPGRLLFDCDRRARQRAVPVDAVAVAGQPAVVPPRRRGHLARRGIWPS